MILELPQYTIEKYTEFTEQYYKKPGVPEIELQLRELQKQILIDMNYSVLPEMISLLAQYAKSILLKQIKGGTDYIEPYIVEGLAEIAANNFIKRYFRNPEPIVGVSFAGILEFKVKEVKAMYFGQKALESVVSLDDTYNNIDDDNNVSKETKLSYKEYLKDLTDEEPDIDISYEEVEDLIETECDLLRKMSYKNMDTLFLKYLLYLILLQKERKERKLTNISKQAIHFISSKDEMIPKITPILESALLDIQNN